MSADEEEYMANSVSMEISIDEDAAGGLTMITPKRA